MWGQAATARASPRCARRSPPVNAPDLSAATAAHLPAELDQLRSALLCNDTESQCLNQCEPSQQEVDAMSTRQGSGGSLAAAAAKAHSCGRCRHGRGSQHRTPRQGGVRIALKNASSKELPERIEGARRRRAEGRGRAKKTGPPRKSEGDSKPPPRLNAEGPRKQSGGDSKPQPRLNEKGPRKQSTGGSRLPPRLNAGGSTPPTPRRRRTQLTRPKPMRRKPQQSRPSPTIGWPARSRPDTAPRPKWPSSTAKRSKSILAPPGTTPHAPISRWISVKSLLAPSSSSPVDTLMFLRSAPSAKA